ncbi:hypothetical protein CJ260_00565 [Megasphaera sp. ASD88]|uniref:hypothetical protein n=1 Tax=Megasphaera sp. ASD88 TaxID=2027407 RepID=UPI000BAC0D55|nr:hypothetical protein [Megasphaera sp. ASD88]PAV39964.1 hypothetical protein CJ260_00565 [Megasphaera sp. ASD88]
MRIFSNKVTEEGLRKIINHVVDLEKQVESLKKEVEAINCEEDEKYFGFPSLSPWEVDTDVVRAGQIVYIKNEFGRYEKCIYLRNASYTEWPVIHYRHAVIRPNDDNITFVSDIYAKKG